MCAGGLSKHCANALICTLMSGGDDASAVHPVLEARARSKIISAISGLTTL